MSLRVLVNRDDDMAVLYQSETDWTFGPVIQTCDGMSAFMLAEAFIKWADLRRRGPFEDWTDSWLSKKWGDFLSLNWKLCIDCSEELIPGSVNKCEKCL